MERKRKSLYVTFQHLCHVFWKSKKELPTYGGETKSLNVTFDLEVRPWPWSFRSWSCTRYIFLCMLVNVCAMLFENIRRNGRVMERKQKNTIEWPLTLGVNLTLKLRVLVLRETHHLILVNICVKLFENLRRNGKVKKRKQKYFNVTFDLEVWPRPWIFGHGYYARHIVLCWWTCVPSYLEI